MYTQEFNGIRNAQKVTEWRTKGKINIVKQLQQNQLTLQMQIK